MTLYNTATGSLTSQSLAALRNLLSDFELTGRTASLNTDIFAQQHPGGTWQVHHIIPKELMNEAVHGDVARTLRHLTEDGLFSIRDGVTNGIRLPSDQLTADATGLARHFSNHTNYTTDVTALLREIVDDRLSQFDATDPNVRNSAAYRTALRAVAADVHGLQTYLNERLSIGTRTASGVPRINHSTVQLASDDSRFRNGAAGNGRLGVTLADVRQSKAYRAGRSNYVNATTLDDLYNKRNFATRALAKYIRQVHGVRTIAATGSSTAMTRFTRALGIAGIALGVANLAVAAYQGGWDGFVDALYEEGTGLVIGGLLSGAALGISMLFPAAAPVIAAVGLAAGVIGIAIGAYQLYQRIFGVTEENSPAPEQATIGVPHEVITEQPDETAPEEDPGETFISISEEEVIGTDGNDWVFGLRTKEIHGGDGDDKILAFEVELADGGAGADWVIAVGGEEAITAGGTGRDWIFNTSTTATRSTD
jgi:hypothetical protein